ncbi:hypothetical protein ABW21_db0201144 [Orbilia brochopaga]|nr:hypothetical protein ABW21_db0201144 [Drechslerella brochopaga]
MVSESCHEGTLDYLTVRYGLKSWILGLVPLLAAVWAFGLGALACAFAQLVAAVLGVRPAKDPGSF